MSMEFIRRRSRAIINAAQARLQRAQDYQAVYDSASGRRVIHDIMRQAGLLTVSHVPGDRGATDYNDGQRSVALYICEQLRWSEPQLVELARMHTGEQLHETEGE